jgi:tripartite-type tricarboxylate transporter receptor subunit TctC
MKFVPLALTLVTVLSGAAPALAQAPYPTKNVTLVVPFPPGGGTDTGARLIAQKLSERWGQPVIVENKPGAAGIIGAEYAAKAKPDGHTLFVGNIGTQSINPSLYKKLPYNTDTAFAPISLIAELPLVLVVNPKIEAKSPADVIALAKSRPGDVTYSTSGSGGSMHLAAALFEKQAGVTMMHVPYKGGGPAIQDLIAGHVNVSFATILETSSYIRSGRLQALAVTSESRSPALPDVPTVAESGLPGFASISWIGLLAPAGTPQPVIDKVAADVRAVVEAPDIRDRLIGQGATPVGSSPAEFKALIEKDRARYAKIIAEKSITADQ